MKTAAQAVAPSPLLREDGIEFFNTSYSLYTTKSEQDYLCNQFATSAYGIERVKAAIQRHFQYLSELRMFKETVCHMF